MTHRLVKWLYRIITNTFFRQIDVVGIENVPATGPVIFAGNHPNALMDGWLLITKCGRWPLHFMANAKLWDYPMFAPLLNASGAVPVYRREEHDGEVDNRKAFERLYAVIEAGNCMGIFPEGISHAESQLTSLKTGTARIALAVAERGKTAVTIIPCGLNYIHRHRFRSQVLIEFGDPITVNDEWADEYREDNRAAVVKLTERLADSLRAVTLNAPDWNTLRFVQTARRLYKPSTALLSPGQYVELSRRFVEEYLKASEDPEFKAFRKATENYQARLDMLGLRDHQLRHSVSLSGAVRKIMLRSLLLLLLLPLAVPAAIVHLPIGWIAAAVGERFSYEMDDVATLKVFSTILLLPVLYLAIAITIAINFGVWWALFALIALGLSFFASVRLIEAETTLVVSMLSVLRLTRLETDIKDLRETRAMLVGQVRALANRLVDPEKPRMFTDKDFGQAARD